MRADTTSFAAGIYGADISLSQIRDDGLGGLKFVSDQDLRLHAFDEE